MKPAQQQLMLSIGALLAAEREKRGIPVEKAAKETRMRPQRIRDMEADDLSHFTNPSYARMFIIAYAKYLDIPMQTIHEHLPDRGEPGTEGYQYINSTPDELPSLRRDLVSRPLRRTWLPTILVVSILSLVVAAVIAVAIIVINLPRLTASADPKEAAAPEGAPSSPATEVVTKTIVITEPNITNLPPAEPKPIDPIDPTRVNPALAPAAASTPPVFTETAQIAAPPKPTPIVVISDHPPATATDLQTSVPTASPATEEDRAFLLNSESAPPAASASPAPTASPATSPADAPVD
ncbi:MAG TPA: helix-turn-helix domain-containing protein [Chthoniobacterales bacterium]|jgi:cytoskeletal protein RodZ